MHTIHTTCLLRLQHYCSSTHSFLIHWQRRLGYVDNIWPRINPAIASLGYSSDPSRSDHFHKQVSCEAACLSARHLQGACVMQRPLKDLPRYAADQTRSPRLLIIESKINKTVVIAWNATADRASGRRKSHKRVSKAAPYLQLLPNLGLIQDRSFSSSCRCVDALIVKAANGQFYKSWLSDEVDTWSDIVI